MNFLRTALLAAALMILSPPTVTGQSDLPTAPAPSPPVTPTPVVSEAERLIAEERARLQETRAAQREERAALERRRAALGAYAETALALRRKVREALERDLPPSATDRLYDEVRTGLRTTRAELAEVLNTLASSPPALPPRGDNPLAALGVEVDRSEVERLALEVEQTAHALARERAALEQRRARQLYEQMRSLNTDRLALLPTLSSDKRSAITGFGRIGFDQALAELRQVGLVLRYHAHLGSRWFTGGGWKTDAEDSAGALAGVAIKWFLILVMFLWGRRAARDALIGWRERLREEARRARRFGPGRAELVAGLLLRVLRPLSWLIFAALLAASLPAATRALMTVDLVMTAVTWTLGGWLVVGTVDYLAKSHTLRSRYRGHLNTDLIRLKSLRLLAVAVVVIGLILALSARMVGRGTLYAWVLNTCWLAAAPLLLLIVHWWRPVIFERIGLARRQGPVERWVGANTAGWKSFPAAVAGGAWLFVQGALRLIRGWLGGFEFTRRILAYLFRQQLERMAEQQPTAPLKPLPEALRAALAPETFSSEPITRATDAAVAATLERIDLQGGGVFVVVGERGSGRSTVLRQISKRRADVAFIDCPFWGIEELARALAEITGQTGAALGAAMQAVDALGRHAAVLIDNAHRLIHPVMGGLAAFDTLIETARHHSTHCAWMIAVDEVIWRFFERARNAQLLFDEVITLEEWPEEDIAQLIRLRSRQAGVTPVFERLISNLPRDADAYDRTEALERAEASYYRLLWDYAGGNPGVALHAWRTSLGLAADGAVHVTPFRVPESQSLERLPDAAVFVLRAVLQLERARVPQVAHATMLPGAEVQSILRYGLQCGHLQQMEEGYAVSWEWYRPITRFLQRRHLLVARG